MTAPGGEGHTRSATSPAPDPQVRKIDVCFPCDSGWERPAAAVFEQMSVHPVEVHRGEPLQRDSTDVGHQPKPPPTHRY